MKYMCEPCGYVYDEDTESIEFDELSSEWTCPVCGAPKSSFMPVEEGTQSITA